MPKVELDDIVLYYSPLSQCVYAGIPDKRAKKGKSYGVVLHKQDVTADFWRCVVQRLQDDDGAPVELRIDGELQHTVEMHSPCAKDRSGTPQAGLPAEEYSGEPDGEAGAPQ